MPFCLGRVLIYVFLTRCPVLLVPRSKADCEACAEGVGPTPSGGVITLADMISDQKVIRQITGIIRSQLI